MYQGKFENLYILVNNFALPPAEDIWQCLDRQYCLFVTTERVAAAHLVDREQRCC